MDIDPDHFTWEMLGPFIESMSPRGGIHPLDKFKPLSRVHILRQVIKFCDEAKGPDGNPFPVKLARWMHDALKEAEEEVKQGLGDQGGEELQHSVGDA